MKKIRHVLGISGGKDSAALAIYMHNKHPEIDMEYYCCDTGKELDETYKLIENLEIYLGKKVKVLTTIDSSSKTPFDHFLDIKNNYLPSNFSRWCTREMKLLPFERYVGKDNVISYVGIRGDEDREGYISKKPNIQSIFPFRKNIWSEDVIQKFLHNKNIASLVDFYKENTTASKFKTILPYLETPLSYSFDAKQKLEALLDAGVTNFNHAVFSFLQTTNYPLSNCEASYFPLLNNEDILIRDDIFRILEESGVGVPKYYKKIPYEVNGETGHYSRSRSGCFFCFFQQRIEWVWLYEQHPDLFFAAMEYEKEGYTWIQNESLAELMHPKRIESIKAEHLKRMKRQAAKKTSPYLLDILDDAEDEGCAACFI